MQYSNDSLRAVNEARVHARKMTFFLSLIRQINNSCLIEWPMMQKKASLNNTLAPVSSTRQICEANRPFIMPVLHTFPHMQLLRCIGTRDNPRETRRVEKKYNLT